MNRNCINEETGENINTLGVFLGCRDIPDLTYESIFGKYGIRQADVMVLFGGSILAGGDVMAAAIRNHIAKHYVIVGGAGHTTDTLRHIVHQEYPDIMTSSLPEAEIFQQYLMKIYGCHADFLETKSTNCGNNITYLLDLLHKNRIPFQSIILCQDVSMQRRMDAGMRKYVSDGMKIINYAAYCARVGSRQDELGYEKPIHGMWSVSRYVNLLMGEIPRLTDDESGYGPNGKNYIAHVDIPEKVQNAFEELKTVFGGNTREANPLYASK
jgi:hypothetical protein